MEALKQSFSEPKVLELKLVFEVEVLRTPVRSQVLWRPLRPCGSVQGVLNFSFESHLSLSHTHPPTRILMKRKAPKSSTKLVSSTICPFWSFTIRAAHGQNASTNLTPIQGRGWVSCLASARGVPFPFDLGQPAEPKGGGSSILKVNDHTRIMQKHVKN